MPRSLLPGAYARARAAIGIDSIGVGLTTAVLSFIFAVWPLIAITGALGFAPLTGLASLLTLRASLPKLRFRIYMLALLAFMAFAAASALWSPRPLALVDFEKLSVRSEVIRVGLLLLAAGALIAATQSMSARGRRMVGRVAVIAFLVQLLGVIALAIFQTQTINFFYEPGRWDEGFQNVTRNTIIMAAVAPFITVSLFEKRGLASAVVESLIVVAALTVVFIADEVFAGLLAVIVVSVLWAVIYFFRKSGFRIIGAVIAVFIMSAPFFFQFLAFDADAALATNSVEYRQVIWHEVLQIIWEKPLFGSGVGVLRTHLEVIPSGPLAGQLYIPNHAHNMLLQLWAETGVVGALLISTAVILAAFRLPRPDQLGATAFRIAAVIGASVATWISFDLWNEAWWAICALLAILTAASFREPPKALVAPSRVYLIA